MISTDNNDNNNNTDSTEKGQEQIVMNFVVDEIVKQMDGHGRSSCPDYESSSFMSLLKGSEVREKITHEISKFVKIKIECSPHGFQHNQFCSPAQTKYSCYVNDVIRVSVVFDHKFLDSIASEQSVSPIAESYCSKLLDKCQVQLMSFVEGSTQNSSEKNTAEELNIMMGKLGDKTNENEKFGSFHIPRPSQKRGKKKEKSTVNTVTKKIGFVQLVHYESRKVLARSENLWIRSKSREEMETKKRRSVLSSKKNKKRKTKTELLDKENEAHHNAFIQEPLMSEQFIKDFFEMNGTNSSNEEEEQGQPPRPNISDQSHTKAYLASSDAIDLKPKLSTLPSQDSSNTSSTSFNNVINSSSGINFNNMVYPFFPTSNVTSYFPNCPSNFVPINPCCHLIPVNPFFFDNFSNLTSCTDLPQETDHLFEFSAFPEDDCGLKRKRSQLTPTDLLSDTTFDFELSPKSLDEESVCDEFPSPLSSVFGELNSPSSNPASATSNTSFWDMFM
ncbi:hypothetical protein FDP41_006282 [Naegleria fowleri]|uniref:Uncharacterized protein n=1 Tax=Naegleria fowleri TaxID=5763 RepID=A0A6A5BKV8_NAEFO|nr:uncharacterized protein FDP41_006282 [Naegleria fowleri]KAF0974808.1 hypothetical protein FDP41_006282 [Naegleria fowleri]CAG4718107.1 unnamed protein product [Naegleria fowleri]